LSVRWVLGWVILGALVDVYAKNIIKIKINIMKAYPITNYQEGNLMYGYKRQVNLTYAQAVAKVREELAKEGFGVLTEIDVKATLKTKLNVNFEEYIIMGACNPPFAYQALQVIKMWV
jgi:hypothetical protein